MSKARIIIVYAAPTSGKTTLARAWRTLSMHEIEDQGLPVIVDTDDMAIALGHRAFGMRTNNDYHMRVEAYLEALYTSVTADSYVIVLTNDSRVQADLSVGRSRADTEAMLRRRDPISFKRKAPDRAKWLNDAWDESLAKRGAIILEEGVHLADVLTTELHIDFASVVADATKNGG